MNAKRTNENLIGTFCVCANFMYICFTLNNSHKMKSLSIITILLSAFLLSACAHSSFGKLVGSDRDEHGCIGSAGYTWSYALHDCVRLWEVGTRFDAGPQQIFLIYSNDSTFAEIFPTEGNSVLCKRIKDTDTWKNKKGTEQVSIQNGVTCIKINNFTYTKRTE